MENWMRFIKWCQRPTMIKLHTFNPGIGLPKLNRGVKAGAVSGAIYGAIGTLVMNIATWCQYIGFQPIEFFPYGRLTLGETLSGIMMERWFWFATIMGAVIGVLIGAYFGLFFETLYDKLPGKSSTMKGIMTAIIKWLALLIFVAAPFGWFTIPTSLGHSILWGWLLGQFWSSKWLGKR